MAEGTKFCEQCGLQTGADTGTTVPQPVVPAGPPAGIPQAVPPPEERNSIKHNILIVAVVLLVVAAGAVYFLLQGMTGTGTLQGVVPASVTTVQTGIPITMTTPVTAPPNSDTPVPELDQFPGALGLRERFPFGSGSVASEATVYRYWINDTYQWHNDRDNRYYVQSPGAGNKYLFVFVQMVNNGDTRVWFPSAGSVVVHYNGARYYQDPGHYKPDKASDYKAAPVEVYEVQYFHKLNGDEYVEDFGFSHGTELGYLYPGTSNAIDGYIIYEVPQSLEPERTRVEIAFNAQDRAVWRLV